MCVVFFSELICRDVFSRKIVLVLLFSRLYLRFLCWLDGMVGCFNMFFRKGQGIFDRVVWFFFCVFEEFSLYIVDVIVVGLESFVLEYFGWCGYSLWQFFFVELWLFFSICCVLGFGGKVEDGGLVLFRFVGIWLGVLWVVWNMQLGFL